MADYKEVAKKMEEGGICKAVVGDYVIYKRKWLYENLEQEITLMKSTRDWLEMKKVDFNRLKVVRDELQKYLQEMKQRE